jgi:hypothetical protein
MDLSANRESRSAIKIKLTVNNQREYRLCQTFRNVQLSQLGSPTVKQTPTIKKWQLLHITSGNGSPEYTSRNMSPSYPALHLHIDCGHGATGSGVFEAVLGATTEVFKASEFGWVSTLEGFLPQIFPCLKSCGFELEFTRERYRVATQIHTDEDLSVSMAELIDMLRRSKNNPSIISDRVLDIVIHVLQELATAPQDSNNTPTSARKNLTNSVQKYFAPPTEVFASLKSLVSAIQTLAVIWCIFELWGLGDSIIIRSFTCSPIPWTASTKVDWEEIFHKRQLQPELILGMPIVEDFGAFGNNDRLGIILLRTLSRQLASYTTIVGKFPPMLLRATATSAGGTGTDINQPTSASVGELLADLNEDTVHSRTRNEPTLWKADRDMVVLETNIDDLTPERLAFCTEQLLGQGAADAWTTPIVMKKGRAAQTLHCLCRESEQDILLRCIFRNSTTLGVRIQRLNRVALRREIVIVQTEWRGTASSGLVDVKVGLLEDEIVSVKAEFDQCKSIALEAGVSIETVSLQAVQLARNKVNM